MRDTELTVTTVAGRVGYGSPFALGAAFKRVHGSARARVAPGAGAPAATEITPTGAAGRR